MIVTGAARGVGKGIAAALTERGASVLLVDRDRELLEQTTGEFTAAGRCAGMGSAQHPGQRGVPVRRDREHPGLAGDGAAGLRAHREGGAVGRLADVGADIGPVVRFLLSDDASFVTGQTIMADGGVAGFR